MQTCRGWRWQLQEAPDGGIHEEQGQYAYYAGCFTEQAPAMAPAPPAKRQRLGIGLLLAEQESAPSALSNQICTSDSCLHTIFEIQTAMQAV